MSSTIYFVHGTGMRDVATTVQQLQQYGLAELGWQPQRVVPIEWGRAVGPQPLNISAALPLPPRDALVPGAPLPDDPAALWGLLLADPYAELRVLAVGPSMSSAPGPGGEINVTASTLASRVLEGLRSRTLSDDAAAAAGVNVAQVTAAQRQLADRSVVSDAANKAGSFGQIVEVVARATVAIVLTTPPPGETPTPLALYDSSVRDALVVAVANMLDPAGQRGIVGDFAKRVAGEIATRVAMRKRVDFMGPLSNFLRDVSFYLQHGAAVRNYIAGELRKHSDDSKVVVLGHSLGGIAAVDLLADPTQMTGPNALAVDLLITVGSQAPYLYLLDSLASLSPTKPEIDPFQPWLNVYNSEDLLSFCAQRVFPRCNNIHDEALQADVPFPASHSAYWVQKRLYGIFGKYLPA